jgi:hypothetical protein
MILITLQLLDVKRKSFNLLLDVGFGNPLPWWSFTYERKKYIYLIRRFRQDSIKQIGRQFNIEKYSPVCSIIERIKKQLQEE